MFKQSPNVGTYNTVIANNELFNQLCDNRCAYKFLPLAKYVVLP